MHNRMKSSHWLQKTHLFRPDEYICSACGAVCDRPYKTCPRCGADMKKTKYDAGWVDEMEGISAMVDEDW